MLHGSPWFCMYSHVGGHPEITTVQPTHAGLKTVKSSLVAGVAP